MKQLGFVRLCLVSLLAMSAANVVLADDLPKINLMPQRTAAMIPVKTPGPPTMEAKAYILIDAKTGKILAEKNADERIEPASLTKMMTMYVVSEAMARGQISNDDQVLISHKSWKTGGSKMYVRVGDHVPVSELVKGIIVQSGNDDCVAMSEHVAGSESSFVEMMNQTAKQLGMTGTHFMDSTGWPNADHYSTARDLATLSRALIYNFPEDYQWYKTKWFTYNNIRQPNRNRLLWRSANIDGIKTGHTDGCGYCLAASGQQDNMRLIAIVLGAGSDRERADDAEQLLNYGFRFFENVQLYKANQSLSTVRVWQGQQKNIAIGVPQDLFITVPRGQYKNLAVKIETPHFIKAPVAKNAEIGELVITLNKEPLTTIPLHALAECQQGGWWIRFKDAIAMKYHAWFTGSTS